MTSEGVSGKFVPETENLHIRTAIPMVTPGEVKLLHPASDVSRATTEVGREAIVSSLMPDNSYDKLVVVTGGCSVHDPDQAIAYTHWLLGMREIYGNELEFIQRVYFEKPRTTIGWEGYIFDPHLDESFDINFGLNGARQLACDITALGMPIGSELLDNITIDYYADLVSWGAIGARTTESPLHRHVVSGLSFPNGFKNNTSGDVQPAINAVMAVKHPHHFPATSEDGRTMFVTTTGNQDCHIILRGGVDGPNYDAGSVEAACRSLTIAGLVSKVMIDASHANSGKDYRRQIEVIRNVAGQVSAGSTAIMGVMIEANLVEGSQVFVPGKKLEYGKSITDGCVGLDENQRMFEILAEAVRTRRQLVVA